MCPPSDNLAMPPSPPAKMTSSAAASTATCRVATLSQLRSRPYCLRSSTTPPNLRPRRSGVARIASTGDGQMIAGR